MEFQNGKAFHRFLHLIVDNLPIPNESDKTAIKADLEAILPEDWTLATPADEQQAAQGAPAIAGAEDAAASEAVAVAPAQAAPAPAPAAPAVPAAAATEPAPVVGATATGVPGTAPAPGPVQPAPPVVGAGSGLIAPGDVASPSVEEGNEATPIDTGALTSDETEATVTDQPATPPVPPAGPPAAG